MKSMTSVEKAAKQVASGKHERIRPGDAIHLTAACVAGDAVRQGDVYVVVVDAPPPGFVPVDMSRAPLQMAHGETKGSRHVLDATSGVAMWLPPEWGRDSDSLRGPVLRCVEARTINHPEHGSVHIAPGLTVAIEYQRNFDKVLQAERRARD